MLRPARTTALGWAAVLVLGVSAVAQAPDTGPITPDAFETTMPLKPVVEVTGAASSDRVVEVGVLTYQDGLRKIRGQLTELHMDWSGAGLPSVIEALWNSDEYEVPGAFGRAKIHAGTFLLRDELGSWAGPFGGVEFADGGMDLQATMLGGAGYTGRCAILNVLHSEELGWQMDGLVFDCRSLQTME